jgi:hypothetical protein
MRQDRRRLLVALGAVLAVALVVLYVRLMIDYRAATIVPYSPTPVVPGKIRAALTVDQRSAPRGALDFPADGATVIYRTEVRGWAVDAGAEDDSGVDRVRLYVDGVFITEADYGMPRQDIADVFGAQFLHSGWVAKLDLTGHPLGSHRLEVKTFSSFSARETTYASTVLLAPRPSAPSGAVDSPADGATVSTPIEIRGWALDEAAASGIGIDRIRLYVDGEFLTEAEMGQSRPDIAAAYGSGYDSAGWRAPLEADALQPGQHRVEARARSTLSGAETTYAITLRVNP